MALPDREDSCLAWCKGGARSEVKGEERQDERDPQSPAGRIVMGE